MRAEVFDVILTMCAYISGNRSRHQEEACGPHFFAEDSEPARYIVAEGSTEDCPFSGRFEHSGTEKEVTSGDLGDKCVNWIQAGCPLSSNMLINFCRGPLSIQKRDFSLKGEISVVQKIYILHIWQRCLPFGGKKCRHYSE